MLASLLSLEAARAAIACTLLPLTERVRLPLAEALGRVLAEGVVAPFDVPAHDNAAMDGYAFSSHVLAAVDGADRAKGGEVRLRVMERRLAGPTSVARTAPDSDTDRGGERGGERGDEPGGEVEGEMCGGAGGKTRRLRATDPGCVRIMTGAAMPEGLDTVVPQEHCRRGDEWVEFAANAVFAGANRRCAGEDLARGQLAVAAGRRLRPADLGLLASLGLGEVEVFRRLRVAVFSTGDELRSAGEPLQPGCIYDSNRASLGAAVLSLGADVIDLGRVPDEPDRLRVVLAEAAAQADVVITSGGVSEGEADFTREVLSEWGPVNVWKLAMRPGRPFAFACLSPPNGDAAARPLWLFGLPGNPVAALVAFYALVREPLLGLSGAAVEPLPSLCARSALPLPKQVGRTEFIRAVVRPAVEGGWEALPTASQSSAVLRSMSEANALIVLAEARGPVAAGEPVPVWLFQGLL